ncbi:MAG: LysE family translocator [Hyphomicrobiales bacterium]|nr:LysE family translocator [Hyphomicrobiales bacterium]
MSWTELFAYIVILATATAIPGPDVAALVGTSLSRGLTQSLTMLSGIIAGHAFWLIAAVSGLAAAAQALGPAFVLVKIAAMGYLLYLAWQLWTSPVDANPSEDGAILKNGRASILTGLMISLSNVKALVFFGAIAPTILPMHDLAIRDVGILLLVNTLIFAVVLGGWAVLAAKARALLTSAARRRGINRISAVILAGTGAAIAAR